MSAKHDRGYKQLFAHPELVRDLLSGFTGLECFRGLEAAAFERVNASYVSEQFSERHGDMVWRVRLANDVLYVYLLLEFQAKAERWMALRMQVYVGLLYQDLVKRHELLAQASLPPVLPVVFYNGKVPWAAREELRHLVAQGPTEIDEFQARQRYLLIDQSSINPEELDGARNLVAELFRIELSDSPSVLMDVVATLSAWLAGPEQTPLRRSIGAWIDRLKERELPSLLLPSVQSLLEDEAMGERFQRKYATWEDAIKDQARQSGLAQGREEGRAEGKRLVLKRQLARRFGEPPPATAARIDAATEAQVERWIERVLDADSVEAVLSS